ncbi:hypothetical protein MNV49_004116 [Pseudohyphozyma bogoriensis]|nr:hypothetical protein MNV49_004116 [Pseudohyphozyma bogoriensis]
MQDYEHQKNCYADDNGGSATGYSCVYYSSGVFKFPAPYSGSYAAITLRGAPGDSSKNDVPGGAGYSMQANVDAATYGNNRAYLSVDVGGGAGKGGSGDGGGYTSIGPSSTFSAQTAIAGGGGGGGQDTGGNGGDAAPSPANGGGRYGGKAASGSTPGAGGGTGNRKGNSGSASNGFGGSGSTHSNHVGGGGWGGRNRGEHQDGGGAGSSLQPSGWTYSGVSTYKASAQITISLFSVYSDDNSCTPPIQPSGHSVTWRKRNAIELQQQFLALNPACPPTLRACALPSGNFECIDFDELTSCGGCVSDGSGVDCLQLPGVQGVQCLDNRCAAQSCTMGYKLRNGRCVPQ